MRGSRGVREASCDLRDVRGQLEHFRDEFDRIIDRLDLGLDPSRSVREVSPMGVVVVGPKPSPKGKALSDALESKSMGQLKDAGFKGKGPREPRVKHQIWPKAKPTLKWRVKSQAGVSRVGLGVGVGFTDTGPSFGPSSILPNSPLFAPLVSPVVSAAQMRDWEGFRGANGARPLTYDILQISPVGKQSQPFVHSSSSDCASEETKNVESSSGFHVAGFDADAARMGRLSGSNRPRDLSIEVVADAEVMGMGRLPAVYEVFVSE